LEPVERQMGLSKVDLCRLILDLCRAEWPCAYCGHLIQIPSNSHTHILSLAGKSTSIVNWIRDTWRLEQTNLISRPLHTAKKSRI
jgi:hypothetical protein